MVTDQSWAMMAVDSTMGWNHLPDTPFYATSLIKVPLAVAALRMVDSGVLELYARIPVRNSVSPVSGVPIVIDADSVDRYLAAKADVPLTCLLERSIIVSSNEATNVLHDVVGFDRVNEVLQRVDSTASVVARHVFDAAASAAGVTNTATAADYAKLMAALYRGELLKLHSSVHIRSLLLAQQDRVGIPAGTPGVGLQAGVVGGLVGNKTGSTSAVAHDVAFVEPVDAPPYVLAVLTGGAALESPEAASAIASIARQAHERRFG